MSDNEVIVRLVTVTLLVSVLVFMQRRRAQARAAFRRRFQRVGDTISIAPLRPRLAAVRKQFTAATHTRRNFHSREHRVTVARQKLSSLPFFQPQPVEASDERRAA